MSNGTISPKTTKARLALIRERATEAQASALHAGRVHHQQSKVIGRALNEALAQATAICALLEQMKQG